MAFDIEKTLALLPPELRDMCRRLQTDTVLEISREKRIPRGRIYDSIKKLHKLFEDAGLRIYF